RPWFAKGVRRGAVMSSGEARGGNVGRMSRFSTGVGALLALGMLVGGCGGGEGAEDRIDDLDSDRARVTLDDDQSDVTTAAESTEPPDLENDTDDVEAAWRSLHGFEQWLRAHPDS